MDNREVRKHKELSILREGVHSNWRDELQEEHPYVDVMPSTGDKQKEIEKKMKELKKAKKSEGEVKEAKSLGMNDPQREIDSMEAKQSSGGNLGAMGRARLNLYKSKFGKKK